MPQRNWLLRAVLAALVLCASRASVALDEFPEWNGPVVIRDVTLIPQPGQRIEHATIVLDRGRIVAAGADVVAPGGAREVDGKGLFAYAGFIDAYSRTGVTDARGGEAEERRVEGDFAPINEQPTVRTPEANRQGISPHRRVEEALDIQESTFSAHRKAGFTTALLAPPRSILAGRASVISLGDRPLRDSVVLGDAAQTGAFFSPRGRQLRLRGTYPRTPLGIIAHTRQTLCDAQWYAQMKAYATSHADARGQIPFDDDLEALQPLLAGQPLIWEAQTADEIHRALNIAEEFRLRIIIAGGREAWRVVDRLRSTDTPVLVTLKVSEKPREFKLDAKQHAKADDDISLYGKSWGDRPFDPKAAYEAAKQRYDDEVADALRLEQAGVRWALAGYELKGADAAWATIRAAIEAGMSADVALRGLTTAPASIFGLENEIGTVEPGRRADLVLFTKPFEDKEAKVRWVFVDGRQLDGEGVGAGGRGPGARGARERGGRRPGQGRRGQGRPDEPSPDKPEGEAEKPEEGGDKPAGAESKPASAPASQETRPPGPLDDIYLHEPGWLVETPALREPGVRTNGDVLLRNANVITVSGADMPGVDVLIQGGRIVNVAPGLVPLPGMQTFDMTGLYVMPGIIDPHSHIALDAVNEFTSSVVPEVRCADVINHDDPDIYRALAGGCTTIHAMHGSANTIGGQCVLLKLKYGRPAAEMRIPSAPRTVKFALGENVKRPGMLGGRRFDPESPRRFPGTRMGVEATLRRALFEGRRYLEQTAAAERIRAAGEDAAPLRRDLRAEALADIVRGDIWINCHSYRADEILRLLEVAEEFGVRVAMLHHCLEAYRIMPEIARHGASTATFSDWWAYKIEAYDAVPQNAGMLLRAGVNSTIKSDSSDLMRHLNLEAAKSVRYAGLSANEALRMVTLNCARGFGLDDHIGSLEPGKDGDIAVFDGHPLDTFSRCVMTIIEGEVYFRHPDFDPRTSRQPAAPRLSAEVPEFVVPAAEPNPGPAPLAAARGATGAEAPAVAIVGATIHPVSGPAIARGTIVLSGGKIAAVGADVTPPAGAQVVQAAGMHVWPGLINAATEVGLHEIDQVEVTSDLSEAGTFQPDIMAVSAFNPHSAMIEVARADGITTCVVLPSGPTIAGQAGAVSLSGWTMSEMLIDPKVGLVVTLPSAPAKPLIEEERQRSAEEEEFGEPQTPEDRILESVRKLEKFFRDAKAYATALRDAQKDGRRAPVPADPRFDAMTPYVLGEKPVFFMVNGYKAILETLLLSEALGLRPVIVGGSDAWKLADLLAKRDVPVIYEGVFAMPRGLSSVENAGDAWDANYRAASVMQKAGVRFCFGHRTSDLAKLLPLEAGFAVSHGLPDEAAVRALTLGAAEILGLADRYGSLEVGKAADVIVTTDHVCRATSRVKFAFIGGKPVSLESKHTRDAAKFAGRPAPNLSPERTDLRGPASQTRRPGAGPGPVGAALPGGE